MVGDDQVWICHGLESWNRSSPAARGRAGQSCSTVRGVSTGHRGSRRGADIVVLSVAQVLCHVEQLAGYVQRSSGRSIVAGANGQHPRMLMYWPWRVMPNTPAQIDGHLVWTATGGNEPARPGLAILQPWAKRCLGEKAT
jgi:hypothetical protein